MQKVFSLRKPKTNIQILQQNVLLRFKYLGRGGDSIRFKLTLA